MTCYSRYFEQETEELGKEIPDQHPVFKIVQRLSGLELREEINRADYGNQTRIYKKNDENRVIKCFWCGYKRDHGKDCSRAEEEDILLHFANLKRNWMRSSLRHPEPGWIRLFMLYGGCITIPDALSRAPIDYPTEEDRIAETEDKKTDAVPSLLLPTSTVPKPEDQCDKKFTKNLHESTSSLRIAGGDDDHPGAVGAMKRIGILEIGKKIVKLLIEDEEQKESVTKEITGDILDITISEESCSEFELPFDIPHKVDVDFAINHQLDQSSSKSNRTFFCQVLEDSFGGKYDKAVLNLFAKTRTMIRIRYLNAQLEFNTGGSEKIRGKKQIGQFQV
ncbi:unnamed protein product [Lepeophtheirus salmonis]|uniref:(salmon louse) hypothetical protein n=1 Tax=Lepeophtheirus salmonis TaxID=72036 RepID=A0A7R8H6U6_LEPSM|nr:unnamed protein product [Lepeophtheirus salmonis]CAF2910436.1 unnamed protein product [Lepeophtheirus salmonis]